MKRRKIKNFSAISATVLACALALACGGGGGDGDGGMMGSDLVATFLGDAAGDLGMTAGTASGSDFEVQIMVDDIDKLFGAAFHVSFDNSSASFLGSSGANSILGSGADFQASLVGANTNELAVSASMTGTGAGIDNATGLLLTLRFRAITETAQNRFTFEPTGSRLVKICPTAGQACNEIVPASWTGGTMMATK